MKEKSLLIFIVLAFLAGSLFAMAQPVRDQEIAYQLEVAAEVTKYIDELFQKFSDGYIEAEIALQKLSLWRNEYNKATESPPESAKKLHELVNKLFSQIENYFIYYKNVDREDININSKIANISFEIYKETIKLQH
ncbi:MAG: hypothetical protein KJ995_01995 [Candidatus Omnitrophica bacterium]|nr:hypothetical protein [Candidatus Omnitrophota bacterium]MBU1128044.1 hypothetical protein [Candidatus Omnitrophota bacterium]MBU1657371.1 hypothetical protein [Candidatus Omnitrophota bacterium]MBU1784631.1 hypothetical protein [Candidatus Omnitrophota bacterium]MBU1851163.1 hypothetical protein [Candidatus Omnitrophota bacterium]